MRSASAKTTSMSCSTSTIVWRPRSPCSRRTIRCDSSVPIPATGSSSNSSRGRVARAMAISSWRCSPWASVPATTSARSSRPISARTARAGSRSAASARAGRQNRKLWPAWACAASATLSSAVKSRKMLVIWNERASPRCERAAAVSAVTSAPAKRMVPASGRRPPASWPISVVLPAPFGPMMASVSPSATSSATSSVATRPPKRLRNPRTASSGSAIAGARQQAIKSPAPVEHDEDEERTEHHLPVHGPRREQVLEQQERDGAEHWAEQGAHAAQDDHDHDVARARPVHVARRQVLRLVCQQGTRQPADRAGDGEGDQLVAERGEADRLHARFVRARRADHGAEARVDQPVAEPQQRDEQAEDHVV